MRLLIRDKDLCSGETAIAFGGRRLDAALGSSADRSGRFGDPLYVLVVSHPPDTNRCPVRSKML
jgi:hypothetical protein